MDSLQKHLDECRDGLCLICRQQAHKEIDAIITHPYVRLMRLWGKVKRFFMGSK